MNKTVVYAYDNNGNITERCEYAYTTQSDLSGKDCTHYSYDYDGDRLINFNGEECAYNNLGNPTIYRGKQVCWQYGERLTQIGDVMFAYDGLGRRTRKNGVYFVYDNENRLIYQSNGLEFIYDNSGVAGIKYKDNIYCYRKDVQGNIIAVLDNSGNVVVKYNYDAWGRHTITDGEGNPIMDSEHIAYLNPFRYRGYYYDTETRLYYLQTRYYDPEVGRFISQDDIDYADPETINGLNLYAYCGNNPVMNVDPTGHFFISLLIGLLIGIGAVAGATVLGVQAANSGADGWGIFCAIVSGLFLGGIIGGVAGLIVGAGAAIIGSGLAMLGIGGGALGLVGGGVVAAGAVAGAVTVGLGTIVVGGGIAAGLIGLQVLFSKGFGPRMGHNQHEKQMWKEAMKKLGINEGNKDLISRLHNAIHKYPYQDNLKGLINTLKEILDGWGIVL